MRAAGVRVVDGEDIAWLGVAAPNSGHRLGHRAEVHRNVLGLGYHPPTRVEERRRAVAPLFYVRGVGAPYEDRPHLLGDTGQGARQDREGYGIQPSVAHLFSNTSVPTPSTTPRHPGFTTQVDSLNSTIAGPSTSEPRPISSRSMTGT